jgi:hypothetical protein
MPAAEAPDTMNHRMGTYKTAALRSRSSIRYNFSVALRLDSHAQAE